MAETASTPAKRTQDDVTVIINRASVGDWLFVQRKLDMTRTEIGEDAGVLSVVLAYFIKKSEGPGASLDEFLNMPMEDLTAFLNIEEPEEDPNA